METKKLHNLKILYFLKSINKKFSNQLKATIKEYDSIGFLIDKIGEIFFFYHNLIGIFLFEILVSYNI